MSNEPSEQYNIDFNINHDPDPIANEKHNVPFVEDDEQIGGFKIGFNKLNEGVAKLLERVKFLEYDKDKNALIVKGNLYTTGAMNSILNFSNFYIDIALNLLNAMEKQLEEEDVEDNLTNEEESINENNLNENINEDNLNEEEDKKDLILINDDEFKEKPFYEIYFIKAMEKLGMKNVFIYSDCLNNGKVLYLYFDSENYIVFRYLNNKITYRLNTDDINSWKDLYEIDLSNYFSKDDRDIRLDKIRYKNYLWKSDRVITLGNNEKITIGIENEEPYFKLDDFGNIECNKINGISISELTKELSNKANIEHKHDWNSIENIPEEFNPSEHNHDNIYLKNNSDINVNTINGHKIINDFAGSNGVPILATIKKDSVMEVGKYIDFHDTNNYSGDYSVRLQVTGNTLEFKKSPNEKANISCGNITGVLNWNSLTNIPEEFNPSKHNHEINEINNLQNELSNKANIEHKHNWDSIENIPEEFNPSEHNHEINEINNLQNELSNKANTEHSHETLNNNLTLQNNDQAILTLSENNTRGKIKVYKNPLLTNNYLEISTEGDNEFIPIIITQHKDLQVGTNNILYPDRSYSITLMDSSGNQLFNNITCGTINNYNIPYDFAPANHNHDNIYSNINHNHDNIYSNINHNHDNIYLKTNSDINVNTINGYKVDGNLSKDVPVLATIREDSVMEVGKYIDFHDTNNYSGDFNVRLHATGNTLEFNKLDGKADINCGNINGVLNCNSTSTHQLGNINIDHASSTAINFHGNANEWRFRINHASWGSNVYRWINFGGWGHGISIIGDNNDAPDGTNTYINITKDGKIEGDNFMKQMIDLIYPVGIVIYLGTTTNPNDLYSGTTWVKLSSGYYIQTCEDNPLSTGGSSTTGEHTLTIDEMPKHSHGLSCLNIRGNEDGSDQYTYAQSGGYAAGKSTNETGGGKAHSHTINPPYIQLIAWRRIETISISG